MSIGSQVTEQIIRECTEQATRLSEEDKEDWYRFRLAELVDANVAELQRDLAGRKAGQALLGRVLRRALEARVHAEQSALENLSRFLRMAKSCSEIGKQRDVAQARIADLKRDLAGREAGMRILERCLEARVAEVATLQGRIAALTKACEITAAIKNSDATSDILLAVTASKAALTAPDLALMKRSKAMERVVDAARDAIGTDGTGKPCFQPDYKYAPPVADALAALDRVTP